MLFNPEAPNGLLLYNDRLVNGSLEQFVALILRNGFVEFRFGLVSAPAVIRSAQELSLNEWHTVMVSRDGFQGTLKIDNEAIVIDSAKGSGLELELNQRMLIGDMPEIKPVAKLIGSSKGFKGCVSFLAVDGKAINLGEFFLFVILY